jgi:hypothetical protein
VTPLIDCSVPIRAAAIGEGRVAESWEGTLQRAQLPKLIRISTTVICLVVCALLIALWALTGRYLVVLETVVPPSILRVHSVKGRIEFYEIKSPSGRNLRNYLFGRAVSVHGPIRDAVDELDKASTLGFGRISASFTTIIWAPYWAFVAFFAGLAVAPWYLSVRFSLRTLLIATTLVAIGLGAYSVALK